MLISGSICLVHSIMKLATIFLVLCISLLSDSGECPRWFGIGGFCHQHLFLPDVTASGPDAASYPGHVCSCWSFKLHLWCPGEPRLLPCLLSPRVLYLTPSYESMSFEVFWYQSHLSQAAATHNNAHLPHPCQAPASPLHPPIPGFLHPQPGVNISPGLGTLICPV